MPPILRFAALGWRSDSIGIRLRWWLFWALAASGLAAGSAFQYRKDVFLWLIAPADGRLSPFEEGLPVYTSPADMWWLTFGFAIRTGLIASLPVLATGMYVVARPFLSRRMKRFLLLFAITGPVLFVAGLAFVYYVMLPASLGFLLNFGQGIAHPLINIRDYFALLFTLAFWIGVVFEIPLVMYLLARTRVVKYRQFKRLRKFVPFVAVILGWIITPTPDLVNQFLVAAPIIVLYEVGMFFAWAAQPEAGNYLWLKSLWYAIMWVPRRPVVAYRWTVRMMRKHGLIWS